MLGGERLVSGFRFSHYEVEKKPFPNQKTSFYSRNDMSREHRKFPHSLSAAAQQQRPVPEGLRGGGWSQAEKRFGDSPFGGGSTCLPA